MKHDAKARKTIIIGDNGVKKECRKMRRNGKRKKQKEGGGKMRQGCKEKKGERREDQRKQ